MLISFSLSMHYTGKGTEKNKVHQFYNVWVLTCEIDVAKSSCSCRSEQSLSRIYVSTAVMAAASCSCSVSSSCWKYVWTRARAISAVPPSPPVPSNLWITCSVKVKEKFETKRLYTCHNQKENSSVIRPSAVLYTHERNSLCDQNLVIWYQNYLL